MGCVRRLISEETRGDFVVRLYEAEMPSSDSEWYKYAGYLTKNLEPKLMQLELRLSTAVADYFRDIPYSLAESLWRNGFNSYCPQTFCDCCCDWPVLYYKMEPVVRSIPERVTGKKDRITLAVVSEDQFVRLNGDLYGDEEWPTPELNW